MSDLQDELCQTHSSAENQQKAIDEQISPRGGIERRHSQDLHDDAVSSNSDDSPPRKRARLSSRARCRDLQDQINHLAGLISQQSDPSSVLEHASEEFLTRPSGVRRVLEFGELKTNVDEKRSMRPAVKERLDRINVLQRFGSSER